jgi:type VI secretion system secreted protein Hcp
MKKIQLIITPVFLLLFLLAGLQQINAQVVCYMSAKGQKQGQIKGDVVQKGVENTIAVYDFEYTVLSPRDPASGLPTGRTTHQPVTVSIPLSTASTLFYNSLVTNENLTQVSFVFMKGDQKYYTVTLTNASIGSMADSTVNGQEMVKISFAFQKIEQTSETDNVTAADDWESPMH